MLPVIDSSTTVAVPADFSSNYSSSSEFLLKDGRKIFVGDCALFKPPKDSPPFIGIIRKLITGEEESLSLGVNWLYRPSDIKLGKGAFLEAAPNEVFYSFHKDEIPAASLLHPCKVAFLHKGVELPSGISSFVCRRVYDIENACLWWLTDKDYINERQEEVDKLLDKTRIEMHGVVPSGGRSPKPLNGPTSTLKPNSDTAQNTTSFLSQGKVKKRERSDQVSEPAKRERLSKPEDRNFGQNRTEHVFKSELAKITDKGGLVDLEGVERLVQLMQPDETDKKIDLAGRIMLADVIAVTDRVDCLGRFVQLRGLPVLDEWLQEVHKGKIGDVSSSKENDKYVEEFLLALLRALDKLPVNLDALQSCNVGRSVNHLRTHKNSEVQKKARSLVDTWKKRVEAEMNMKDTKTISSRGVSWPTKPASSEVSHVGNRKPGGSADAGFRSSVTQSLSSKNSQVKFSGGEGVAKSSSPGAVKSMTTQVGGNPKDPSPRVLIGHGTSDPLLTPIKEERSSSSSQSQNNSQSCSSDHAKTIGSSCREDARSSTTGSVTVSRSSAGASHHRKSNHGVHGSVASGVQKEPIAVKVNTGNRSSNSDKVSPTGVSHDKGPDMSLMDHGNNQRLIVRLPNTSRSPSRGASGASSEDLAAISGRTSSPPEKQDSNDLKARGRGEVSRCDNVSTVNSNLFQGKDGQSGHDEGNVVTASNERQRIEKEGSKMPEESKATDSQMGIIPRLGKSYDASLSSINALVESCAKFSEASASASPEDDDVGMNLLASVAAGEILRADTVPPSTSHRNSPVVEESSSGDDVKFKHMAKEAGKGQCKPIDVIDGGPTADILNSVDLLSAKNDLGHPADKMLTHASEECRVPLIGSGDKGGESSFTNLQQSGEISCLKSDVKPSEQACDSSVVGLPIVQKVDGRTEVEGVYHSPEGRISGNRMDKSNFLSELKSEGKTVAPDDERKGDCANERVEESSVAAVPELAVTDAKCGKEVNEKPASSSVEASLQKRNAIDNDSSSGVSKEQKSSENVDVQLDSSDRKSDDASLPSSSGMSLVERMADVPDSSRAEGHVGLNERPGTGSDHNIECNAENLDRSCASVSHVDLPMASLQENELCEKSKGFKSDAVEPEPIIEPHASGASGSVSAGDLGMSVKLDFDLNEGFSIDDGNQGEPSKSVAPEISSIVHLPCPLPIPISSMSGTMSTSITVAAAAKGPFVLPENPLRAKGELGWKGSAATSAFRPAEPRKNLEMALNSGETSMIDVSGKQGRTPLDFDLNIPDDRVLEDVNSQNSARASCSESGARDRFGGGFDLDLNKIDEGSDTGLLSNNSSHFEISKIPSKLSIPGGLSNGALNISRGFDLNNGPSLDEVASEAATHNQSVKSSLPFPSPVAGLRMSSAELGNFSSWYLPANAYSALTVPSVFPGRGEHIVAPAGSQRILAPPNVSTTFGPEMYRGSVLSSSPAVPFPTATPFQYPGFPFETSFPLPSNTFSGASTAYMESSSGNALGFPTVPSQLVGPACVVSSPYSRQYVMNLPGGSSNASSDSRKWGGQLDLNAGPGLSDGERRDERLPPAIRQHTLPGSQAMTEEQMKMYQVAGSAGNSVFKRKDPDGGWDTPERFHNYRQSSWQ